MEDNYFPAMMVNAFEELGGVPGISQYHTVFGKVIDGMEVVDAINELPMTAIDMEGRGRFLGGLRAGLHTGRAGHD